MLETITFFPRPIEEVFPFFCKVGNLARIAARFRLFHFQSPERDIDMALFVFPSLTDLGRVRNDYGVVMQLKYSF